MTTLLAAAVLGLAAAATPAPAPAAAPPAGPWVVVQKDGGRVIFASPPELRSGRWVGRMQGSGTLVSVPAARVDEAATSRANAPGAQAEEPAPRAAPTPRPFETSPLVERAKLKTSGEEASRVIEGARKGAPAPVPSPGGEVRGAGAELEENSPPTDRNGRGEEYWRERAAEVRGDYEEAGQRLAVAEARLEEAERAFLGRSEAERNTFVLRIQKERAFAEAARQDYRRASAAWEALQEEARKAGAFPGWLR